MLPITTALEGPEIAEECEGSTDKSLEQLLPAIYEELKRTAARYMRGERSNHTLQPTALVHEALLRMQKLHDISWAGRSHFCAVAGRMMRRILIDYARRRGTQRRGGGGIRLHFTENLQSVVERSDVDLLDLNEALNRLAELNPRHAQVVEFRFFAGLTVEETAALLNVSPTTVKNDWQMARAWLLVQLEWDKT